MTTANRHRTLVGPWIAAAALACTVATLAASLQRGNGAPSPQNDPNGPEWIQLFDGRSLDGWTPKFAKHDLGFS